MNKNIITSYINPDMDGISSMYAYAEYLKKSGKEAYYYYEGNIKREVQIVLDMYGIKLEKAKNTQKDDNIILVDTNSLEELPKRINKKNIIEIYDHHKKNPWLDGNNKIKINIEWIGAAATLIAEKFKNKNIEISKESAVLLYFGIISNIINLKIKMTTKRDIDAANWLKTKVPEINDKAVETVFTKKSEIKENLRAEMEIEFVDKFMTISWTMGQLEIANVDDFLLKNENKIRKILTDLRSEKNVKYISVNCMDIINGYTVIVAIDEQTAELIGKSIGIKFVDLKGKIDYLKSRKEIVKAMRDLYKKE